MHPATPDVVRLDPHHKATNEFVANWSTAWSSRNDFQHRVGTLRWTTASSDAFIPRRFIRRNLSKFALRKHKTVLTGLDLTHGRMKGVESLGRIFSFNVFWTTFQKPSLSFEVERHGLFMQTNSHEIWRASDPEDHTSRLFCSDQFEL